MKDLQTQDSQRENGCGENERENEIRKETNTEKRIKKKTTGLFHRTVFKNRGASRRCPGVWGTEEEGLRERKDKLAIEIEWPRATTNNYFHFQLIHQIFFWLIVWLIKCQNKFQQPKVRSSDVLFCLTNSIKHKDNQFIMILNRETTKKGRKFSHWKS